MRETVLSLLQQGLRDTERGKFEGGDANWEESRQGTYQDSELRLIEIQEKLCDDLSSGKDQCHHFAEDSEAALESWWFKGRKQGTPLFSFLCVDQKSVCCESNFFGPDCSPCPGFPGPFCNSRGSCNGNGTRSGTGLCDYHDGYEGGSCTECAEGYFVNSSDPLTCLACDRSCLGHCRFAGPKGCEVCRSGYIWDADHGCSDVDECLDMTPNPCRGNTLCINTDGSYQCYSKLAVSPSLYPSSREAGQLIRVLLVCFSHATFLSCSCCHESLEKVGKSDGLMSRSPDAQTVTRHATGATATDQTRVSRARKATS